MGGWGFPIFCILWYVVVYSLGRGVLQGQVMVICSVFRSGLWRFSGYIHAFVVEVMNFARGAGIGALCICFKEVIFCSPPSFGMGSVITVSRVCFLAYLRLAYLCVCSWGYSWDYGGEVMGMLKSIFRLVDVGGGVNDFCDVLVDKNITSL